MLYFDIESLNNIFTLCTYAEKPHNNINVFYLVEPDCQLDTVMYKEMNDAERQEFLNTKVVSEIIRQNPTYADRITLDPVTGLPQINIRFFDLRELSANVTLATIFGLSDADLVNDPTKKSVYTEFSPAFRLVCDTDANYNPTDFRNSYIAGYNSFNYDTSMLALYLQEAFSFLPSLAEYQKRIKETKDIPGYSVQAEYMAKYSPVLASSMRGHNDNMFTNHKDRMPDYLSVVDTAGSTGYFSIPNRIRRNMIMSGRYIDIAKFNEKQQRVGLKRLLGMLGYQILESEKLSSHNANIETLDDFAELIAYNVSDNVELGELFKHNVYSSGFDIKVALLNKYPETIYSRDPSTGKPDINPAKVRSNRLTPDSTSARFVATVLAPYDPLDDIKKVSYDYPAKEIAEKLGIEQRNVLESAKEFFYENITDPEARKAFDEVYKFYKDIEGKNFNDSNLYQTKYGIYDDDTGEYSLPQELLPQNLANIEKRVTTIPYFRKDGTPTSCFVNFSTGGIHGSELDLTKYEMDMAEYEYANRLIAEAKEQFPDPIELRKNKGFTNSDGEFIEYNKVLVGGKKIADSQYKDNADKQPTLVTISASGNSRTNAKYGFTTVAQTIHEDFSSYYPNMLRNMMAFENPTLGEDRYAILLGEKDEYHKAMNAKGISLEEKTRLNILRNGVKLLLNTASGAGDTTYDTNIRMNNVIISMRIIGQIMSWRIGQAQTFAGALIPSTNTDGLYSVLDAETNNRVLEEQQKSINIEIEPEPVLLVSKDSNSRLELMTDRKDANKYNIVSASGGTLACYNGPNPTQSLAHPAMIDYLLAHYLKGIAEGVIPKHRNTPLAIDEPFDREYALQIIKDAFVIKLPKTLTKELNKDFDTIEDHNNRKLKDHYIWLVKQFQTVIAASTGSLTFPVAADPIKPNNGVIKTSVVDTTDPDNLTNLHNLQHYNRVFITLPGAYANAVSIQAMGCYKVNPLTQARRKRTGGTVTIPDHNKLKDLMAELGYTRNDDVNNELKLLPPEEDLVIRKVSGIEPTWHMRIENRNLYHMDIAELENILATLDIETYITMAEKSFTKNWMNG